MTSKMTKRDFLKWATAFTAQSVLTAALSETFFISSSFGASVNLADLHKNLADGDGIILVPTDAQFTPMQISFNKRTMITPTVRVLCLTEHGISVCLQWAQQNKVPLAIRCGGHSYEGFSQSPGLVIDTRMMNEILSSSSNTVLVGGGVKLGDLNTFLTAKKLAIPVGSCPTVGVSGHATGGGYGLLARPFGLACDNLESLSLVTADGQRVTASATENQNLFWACRGGGGGSFGIITRLEFKAHQLSNASVFRASWSIDETTAAALLQAWQGWASGANSDMTCLMKIAKIKSVDPLKQLFSVKCIGQTIGSETSATQELTTNIFSIKKPDSYTIATLSYADAVKHFSGADTDSPSVYMKGKSDYIKTVMSNEGLKVFFKNLPDTIAVIFDSYGGKIRDLKDDDTAFRHRSDTICSVQYYSEWSSSMHTASRLNQMRTFYNLLRPYVSGSAYVNYCDLDLKDWKTAYWGENLDRLIEIKKLYDPENLFNHAQSIPLT